MVGKARKGKGEWQHVKPHLLRKSAKELVAALGELYKINRQNRDFLESYAGIHEGNIEAYKKRIEDALYPDVYSGKRLQLTVGRRAVSDYERATGNELGKLELMMHYVECGNRFTVEFGDIDEQFYSSLISMFERVVKALEKQNESTREAYRQRCLDVVDSSNKIGWGYHDCLVQHYYEAFPDEDE